MAPHCMNIYRSLHSIYIVLSPFLIYGVHKSNCILFATMQINCIYYWFINIASFTKGNNLQNRSDDIAKLRDVRQIVFINY